MDKEIITILHKLFLLIFPYDCLLADNLHEISSLISLIHYWRNHNFCRLLQLYFGPYGLIFFVLFFSTSASLRELQKLSRVTVVDNSMLGRRAQLSGKRPYIIHVYNKMSRGYLGDKVLLAISGKKKRAYIVGCRQQQKAMVPRFDSNNVVLIEDNGTPTATRIRSPIPSVLRGKEGDFTKILSMASKFV